RRSMFSARLAALRNAPVSGASSRFLTAHLSPLFETLNSYRSIGNVSGNEADKVTTKSRTDQKIDTAVAVIMAMGRAVLEDEQAKGLDGIRAEAARQHSARCCGRICDCGPTRIKNRSGSGVIYLIWRFIGGGDSTRFRLAFGWYRRYPGGAE